MGWHRWVLMPLVTIPIITTTSAAHLGTPYVNIKWPRPSTIFTTRRPVHGIIASREEKISAFNGVKETLTRPIAILVARHAWEALLINILISVPYPYISMHIIPCTPTIYTSPCSSWRIWFAIRRAIGARRNTTFCAFFTTWNYMFTSRLCRVNTGVAIVIFTPRAIGWTLKWPTFWHWRWIFNWSWRE